MSLYIMKQIPDVLVVVFGSLCLVTVLANSRRIVGNATFRATFPLLLVLLLVLTGFFLQTLSTGAPLSAALQTKALVRYVFAGIITCYCVVPGFERRFTNLLMIAATIQLVIVFLQIYDAQVFGVMFLPNTAGETSIGGIQDHSTGYYEYLQSNHVSGTFRHNIGLAFFFLVVLSVILFEKPNALEMSNFKKISFAFLIVTGVYYSGSRIALIAAIFLFLLLILSQVAKVRVVAPLLIIPCVAGILYAYQIQIGVDSTRDQFTYIFSEHYIQNAEKQRLGLLYMFWDSLKVSPTLLVTGLGFDHNAIYQFIWSENVFRPALMYWDSRSLEDVYWIALVYYYGLAFVAALVLTLFYVMRSALRSDGVSVGVALLVITCVCAFFNQSFEVRTLSYYLWVYLAFSLSNARRLRPMLSRGISSSASQRTAAG